MTIRAFKSPARARTVVAAMGTRTYKDPDTFYLTTTQKKLFRSEERRGG